MNGANLAAGGGPRVVIVGGGLAGLAAAVGLAESGCHVTLLESRRVLGGRATSFRDPHSDELVDHCQHVGMACCTNLVDFFRRTGLQAMFRRDRVLHFVDPQARVHRFEASDWLPAPLHLSRAFWRMKFLSPGDRWRIARAMWKLMRLDAADPAADTPIAPWLRAQRQSEAAIERFWSVVLTSALGEQLERASLAAARKVIVDGFLASRTAYQVDVPVAPLGQIHGQALVAWLSQRGVRVEAGRAAKHVSLDEAVRVETADGKTWQADYCVLAVPWTKLAAVVDPAIAARWPWLEEISRLESAPITGVHLWFDRPIMDLPHAALVGRVSQWVFNRGHRPDAAGYYYQVVISASYGLSGRARNEIASAVRDELAAIWPQALGARLLQWRVVTEHGAVFSPRPGVERLRPSQQTDDARLLIAGDWTATGWPATMESAVRSGYLAAEHVLASWGRPRALLAPDLPRGWLARLLIR